MTNPASRLITLILLLQRGPGQKAPDLARELGVSVRTLHRYLTQLDEMGIPIYSERGPQGGFSLVRGYKMPPLVFTPDEAVCLSLGAGLVAEIWGEVYRQAAQGAFAKLENVLPDDQRSEVAWARRSFTITGLQRADVTALRPNLEKLRRAIRELHQVRMRYRAAGKTEPTERKFDPYRLIFRSGWWYVVGYCHLRQAVRIFRIDRILELEICSEACQIPPGFRGEDLVDLEFQDQPQVQARLRFPPEAAQAIRDQKSAWPEQEEQPDGSVVVTMVSPDLDWAASSALMFGLSVEVLDPPELRKKVREWALDVAKKYEEDHQT